MKQLTICLFLAILALTGCGETQSPTPERIVTVTLDIQQEFVDVPNNISLPVKDAIQRQLQRVNVLVVEPGQTAGASLVYELKFTPLKAEIDMGIGKITCWNGAEVTGQMTLIETGKEPRQFRIKNTWGPETFIVMECPKVEEAPFGKIWAAAILEPLAQAWDHDILLMALEDEDPSIRDAALWLLDEHEPEPPEAIPAIIKMLEDPDDSVISTAALILAQRKEASAVPALIASIQRTDEASRKASFATIYALNEIGPAAMEATPVLIALLKDETTVNSAASALKAITGQDFGTDASRWQEWWDQRQ